MSAHRAIRPSLAAVLAALALAACGGGFDAKAEPRPASSSVAVAAAPEGDECGTAERPCVLQEIRVSAAAAE